MRHVTRTAACLLALLGAGMAIGAATNPVVDIGNFAFAPKTISVAAGTRLTFRNHDDVPHSIVIPDLQVNSGMLDTDDKFETALTKPGTYTYFCGVHPQMTGKITVTAP